MPHNPCIITLHGELDLFNRTELEQALLPAYESRDVVIDFSGVRYMDSTALSVFVRKRKRREGLGYPPASFAGVNENVKLIFSLTGLLQIWPQYASMQDALHALGAPAT